MWSHLRRLAVPIFVLSLSGAAFASAQVVNSHRQDAAHNSSEVGQVLDTGDELETGDELADGSGSSPQSPTARSTDGCQGFEGNHGQYVSSTQDRPRNLAAHSNCGKPMAAVEHSQAGDDDDQGEEADEADGEDHDGPHSEHANEHASDGHGHEDHGEDEGESDSD